MRSVIIKIIFGIIIIGIIFYMGACAYVNFVKPHQSTQATIKMPKAEEAAYEVIIINTGTVYLSDDVTRVGSFIKLNTFWELQGKAFVYQNRTYLIDENIFGKVQINLRKQK